MSNETLPPEPIDAEAISRSQKPYMLRAMHEWLSDLGYTPHIVVDLRHPGLVVPAQLRVGPTVVLNIAMRAASQLVMGNEIITFAARFNQKSFALTIPVGSVVAIYSKETQVGMALKYHENTDAAALPTPPVAAPSPAPSTHATKRPTPSFLKVIK